MVSIVINDVSPRVQYTASSGQTVFSYTFPILEDEDLLVYQRIAGSTPDDATDILILTTDYTVTGAGVAGGGTVVLNSGATLSDIVTIVRAMSEDRLSLYLNGASLTAAALNTDFNRTVLMAQQNLMFTRKVAPQYQTNATINNNVDLKLPILGANEVWRKNDGNTEIETTTLPEFPVGATTATTGTDNHLVRWDGTNTLIIQDSTITVSDAGAMSGVTELTVDNVNINGNTITNGTSDLLLTGSTGVKLSGIKYPIADGTSGQVIYTDGSGTLAFTSVPNMPTPSTDNAIARFNGVAGQLQNSGVIIDDSDNMSGGTWQGTVVSGTYGGTGVDNGASTITVGGNVTFTGAFTSAFTFTANTAVTFPTSGTLATTAGTVSSVTGTANRITSSGGTTPVIDISASYVGQNSITTLGTVGTGTWQGTVVGGTYGGTGVNNGASTITLGGNLTTSGAFTTTFTVTGNTNVTLPTSGTLCTTVGSASIVTVGTITSGTWNGTAVDVAHGGTGNTSTTAYAVQCGGTTSTGVHQAVSGVGTSGQVLTSNGAGALPTWQATGSVSQSSTVKSIAQTAHGLAVGNVVRFNGTDYVKAQADSSTNALVVGIVSAVADANNFTLLISGYITGLSSLVAGTQYFLDQTTAGAVTATEPLAAGKVSKVLLIADSTTSGYFNINRGLPFQTLQRVSTQTGAVATGTTQLPYDDTIPQNTEGDQYMTLAITPKSASSILVIEISAYVASSIANSGLQMGGGLFQDTTANALAAASGTINMGTTPNIFMLNFTHVMTSGTTSSTTFKLRMGANFAGTTTFNGSASARIFGGVIPSSIIITEYSS